MVDGFKMRIKNPTDPKKEWERRQNRKELRTITIRYANYVLGTNNPEVKSTINNKDGAWANRLITPEGAVVLTRAKKKGGHIAIPNNVIKVAEKRFEPIIAYVDAPRGKKPWAFYKFSPVRILEETQTEGGTTVEDGLVWFRLQLGIYEEER